MITKLSNQDKEYINSLEEKMGEIVLVDQNDALTK